MVEQIEKRWTCELTELVSYPALALYYLEGQGDSVSTCENSIDHITTPTVSIVDLLYL